MLNFHFRFLRSFDIQTKKVLCRTQKGVLPLPESHSLFGKKVRYYHDDTLQTFFRRLKFSIDGRLLITPCGVIEYENGKYHHSTYIFSRNNLTKPLFVLPCTDQYSVAVACCPNLYKLRPYDAQKNSPAIPLPYRMILAIATRNSVFFYDTQQRMPFSVISNIHYTRLTDISWSSDGQLVVVSSTDGFCSLITFGPNELGEIYVSEEKKEKVDPSSLPFGLSAKNNEEKGKKAESDDEQDQTGQEKTDLVESKGDVEIKDLSVESEEGDKKTSGHKSMEVDDVPEKETTKITENIVKTDTSSAEKGSTDKEIEVEGAEIVDGENIPETNTEKTVNGSKSKRRNDKVGKIEVGGKKRKRKDTLDYFIEKRKLSAKEIEEKKSKRYTLSIIGSMILGSGNRPRPSRFSDQPAKPIPIRRTPRSNSSGRRGGRSLSIERVTNVATLMEEALHSWPTDKTPSPTKFLLPVAPSSDSVVKDEKLSTDESKQEVAASVIESAPKCSSMEETFEHTEDIRLVYEDDTQETNSSKAESSTGATIGSLGSLDQGSPID